MGRGAVEDTEPSGFSPERLRLRREETSKAVKDWPRIQMETGEGGVLEATKLFQDGESS